jgi:hypothetical protein
MCNLFRRRGIRTQSAPSFASPTTPPETCRRCRRSFPNNSLQSCVMGRAAMSSSWPVGACPARHPMEASRSPTSGTSQVRTGVCGGWLKRENRCIVPATSFCEYDDAKPRKTPTWFALNDDRPLFAFRRALDPLDQCQRPVKRALRGANTSCSDFSRRRPMRSSRPSVRKRRP